MQTIPLPTRILNATAIALSPLLFGVVVFAAFASAA